MSNNSHAFRILIHILPSAAWVNYVTMTKMTFAVYIQSFNVIIVQCFQIFVSKTGVACALSPQSCLQNKWGKVGKSCVAAEKSRTLLQELTENLPLCEWPLPLRGARVKNRQKLLTRAKNSQAT